VTADTGVFTTSVTSAGLASVGTWLRLAVQATQTITNGDAITPTGTLMVINSAVAYTVTTIAAGTTGDVLILRTAASSETIQLGESGNINVSTENDWLTLLADQVATLYYDGSKWVVISTTGNFGYVE
jgi:hypothetical protein